MHVSTADLCDAHSDLLQVCEPIFQVYGGRACFAGEAVPLKVFEDNSLVRETLESDGAGRVLVVDGGGSLRCALVGDQLAELSVKNGWTGILVYGCVRDSEAMASMNVGIRALNTHPRKSVKRGEGQRNVQVRFAGVTISPGHWVYADRDGVVVAPHSL